MITHAIVGGVVMTGFVTSLALSVWNLRKKMPAVDRVAPMILQLFIIGISLTPSLHGHPRELFIPLILTFCWAVWAIFSSCRLYMLHQVGTVQALGVALFTESVGIVLLAAFGYADACFAWYGHIVWNQR